MLKQLPKYIFDEMHVQIYNIVSALLFREVLIEMDKVIKVAFVDELKIV